MRKLILRNFQSAGDIVMLTAAVRDLHRTYPGEFITDVRTPFPGLWAGNPHITPLAEDDPAVRVIVLAACAGSTTNPTSSSSSGITTGASSSSSSASSSSTSS